MTLVFLIQMLMVALSIGTGVGANVMLAKSLGQGDKERAGIVSGNSMFSRGAIYIICLKNELEYIWIVMYNYKMIIQLNCD